MSKFLNFVPLPSAGKTKKWAVRSMQGDMSLGEVAWYAPWRRYCFQPRGGVLFDADCLSDLTSFIAERTNEQKLTWKRPARRK